MGMGQQYADGSGSSRGRSGLGVENSGSKPEKKAGMAPTDYVYRIATLVAVIFLLATVF
jgi:hypothetical protein